MRKPKKPPSLSELMNELRGSGRLAEILGATTGRCVDTKYLHWDKLRYHEPPGNLGLGAAYESARAPPSGDTRCTELVARETRCGASSPRTCCTSSWLTLKQRRPPPRGASHDDAGEGR